jgi:hypothetical protein
MNINWFFPYSYSQILTSEFLHITIPDLLLITLGLNLLTAFIIFFYVKKYMANRYALISFAIFFLTPATWYISLFDPFVSLILFEYSYFFYSWKNSKKVSFVILSLLSLTIYFGVKRDLLPKPVTYYAYPKETSYLIDHSLSTGFLFDSPLITKDFNFNRIYYNKLVFGLNEVLRRGISAFDIEKIVVPNYSLTILGKESPVKSFPQLLNVWQFFLLIYLLFFSSKKFCFQIFPIFIAITLLFVFGDSLFALLIPIMVIYICASWENADRRLMVLLIMIALINTISSLKYFLKDQPKWMNQNDYMQSEIWKNITSENLRNENIIITDRFGDPSSYANAYLGEIPKNVVFGSFQFWENSTRDIFIGLPGEFVKNGDYSNGLPKEKIIKKLEIPRPVSNPLGNEIWIVRKQ